MSYLQPQGLMRGTHQMTPIHTNRFLFTIDNDPRTKLFCKSANRPNITHNEIPMSHVNKTRYVKGKSTHEPLNVVLYDYINPSVAQLIMEWSTMHAEMFTGRDGYESFYRRQCTLEILGGPGDVIQRWDYYNCFITNANFGEFDWDNDAVQTISLTIRYDDVLMRF